MKKKREVKMIIKMNNKDEKFYYYMGRIFGSRIIQRQTNDRIYDDSDKEWYLNIEDERVVAFVSLTNNTIKNVYTIKDNSLSAILKTIRKEIKIKESIAIKACTDIIKVIHASPLPIKKLIITGTRYVI